MNGKACSTVYYVSKDKDGNYCHCFNGWLVREAGMTPEEMTNGKGFDFYKLLKEVYGLKPNLLLALETVNDAFKWQIKQPADKCINLLNGSTREIFIGIPTIERTEHVLHYLREYLIYHP